MNKLEVIRFLEPFSDDVEIAIIVHGHRLMYPLKQTLRYHIDEDGTGSVIIDVEEVGAVTTAGHG